MSQMDVSWEWDEVIRGLNALQEVEAVFNGHHFLLLSQLMREMHCGQIFQIVVRRSILFYFLKFVAVCLAA
jgi:hypothetical protein